MSLNEVFKKHHQFHFHSDVSLFRYNAYTALLYPVASLIEMKCSSCFGLAHVHVACLQPEHAVPLKGFFTSTILVFVVTQYTLLTVSKQHHCSGLNMGIPMLNCCSNSYISAFQIYNKVLVKLSIWRIVSENTRFPVHQWYLLCWVECFFGTKKIIGDPLELILVVLLLLLTHLEKVTVSL